MQQSQNDVDHCFATTNQDYGSFYSDRIQSRENDLTEIDYHRQRIPSIAYEIIFDELDSPKIVNHQNKSPFFKNAFNISYPIVSRRQLKFLKFKTKINEERQCLINTALESYKAILQCIYQNIPGHEFHISDSALELIGNELFLLNPNIDADELTERMIAMTVPHQHLGTLSIDPNRPYPGGSETDCTETPCSKYILKHFQKAEKMVAECKQRFDTKVISSQPMQGVKYVYKPFG